MKLHDIKAEVFKRAGVTGTIAFKLQRPDLTKGRDLRYKSQWLEIRNLLENDLTIDDLERENIELKQSLHRVGRLMGTSVTAIEEIWQTIEQNSQAKDIDLTLAELEV